MNAFATQYGLNFAEFRQLLTHSPYLVAGSSALANYLAQEGQDPGFTPNDMDIWIEGPVGVYYATDRSYLCHPPVATMTQFLLRSGYQIQDQVESKLDEPYHQSLNRIQRVFYFQHPQQNTHVQLILVQSQNLLHYIYQHFDLSICMSWYNADQDKFQTVFPEDTLGRVLLVMRNEDKPRTQDRIRKYMERGFKQEEEPPITNLEKDERDILYSEDPWELRDKTAFDCIELEDRPVVEFLKESPWHILLKSGETYYAFHRQRLLDCMKKKRITVKKYGDLFDTPFNQSLNEIQLESLRYSDFSIYELTPSYSLTLDDVHQKSVFDLHCYSIADRPKPVCRMTMYSYPLERVIEAHDEVDDNEEEDNEEDLWEGVD